MQPQEFINLTLPGALEAYRKYNILPSLTLAQGALESGWGRSAPGNMLFGIKWTEGCGYDKQLLWTSEHLNGKWVKVQDWFRKYETLADSIYDHAMFLVNNSRYAPVLKATDYREACQLIRECGYATDPEYTTSLINIIEANGLNQWDGEEWKLMNAKEILKSMAAANKLDSLEKWERAMETIQAVPGNMGDLEVLKYVGTLIEKVYAFAKGE